VRLLLLRIIAYTVLATTVQIVAVVIVFVMSAIFSLDLPLVAVVYTYFPTIFLIQSTGNFVGCANMVQPFLLGVPLGMVLYGLIGSSILTVIQRLRANA
jgi:hypothetical protein